MSNPHNKLPDGWNLTTLGEAVDIETNSIHPAPDTTYVYVGLEQIESETGNFVGIQEIEGSAIQSQKYIFTPNHLLYGKLRPYLNKVALPSFSGICSTDILPLITKPSAIREYIAYWLRSSDFISYANNHATGTKMPRLNPTQFGQATIPLPPLPVQERIVQILQKADEIRRKRQEALAIVDAILPGIFYEMFGDPSKSNNTKSLSEGLISIRNGINRRRKALENRGIITLRIQDVGDGYIDFSNPNRIELSDKEKDSFLLNEGDVLLVRVNGNPSLVGRSALFKGSLEPVAHNDHLIRIRFNQSKLLPEYVLSFLRTPFGRQELSSKVATSAGNHTINQEGLGSIRIPFSS